ncbi:hypothetical protein C4N9_18590 [Pararhodobacter marinus]|uniref:DUF2570 domain-containing protein n=1 Tax=Pararhodobacter marinus TaxID=2184063 RepID=A0A2U2C5E4_9RHOB|nr:hypothetical protein [Pararhodobacter marinus]PWE27014.1 hypothetical protein C4N9_18590 [Pararhodobacter marinus]
MTILISLFAPLVGRALARVLAPVLLILAALGVLWGAVAWHDARIEALRAEIRDAMAREAEAAANAAELAAAWRLYTATRAAGDQLAAARTEAERAAAARRADLARYIEDNPHAPDDCAVSPDLLRLLR